MTCSAFVNLEYTKDLEEKITKITGIVPDNRKCTSIVSIQVPENLFSQHKKEVEAHKVPKNKMYGHLESSDEWEYKGHGFEIWLNFQGNIVFITGCHWNEEHGEVTITDFKKWITDNLGDVKIKSEEVT